MRTVVEDDAVRRALDAAVDEWPRIEDAWNAVTWAISRDHTIGDPVTESGLIRAFVFEGAISIGMPTIRVLYVVEPELITVASIFIVRPRFSQVGRA